MKDHNTQHGDSFCFNESVADVFSDMLERSIPSYSMMRSLMFELINSSIISGDSVLDIGTSNGEALDKLSTVNPECFFHGLDMSEYMVVKAKERFNNRQNVKIAQYDLRKGVSSLYPYKVIISCLTIQFTPIEYRLKILKSIFDNLSDNGMFIIVEKVIGASADIDAKMIDTYYNIKLQNGYSYDEIQRKKMALEGVLVPVTAKWNEELLKTTGFTQVDCFWRCLNFAGWIAYK